MNLYTLFKTRYNYHIIMILLLFLDVSVEEYALRDPLLFGDYRNMINENEPRFYEDLLDYEAIYFLFQEVRLLPTYS